MLIFSAYMDHVIIVGGVGYSYNVLADTMHTCAQMVDETSMSGE